MARGDSRKAAGESGISRDVTDRPIGAKPCLAKALKRDVYISPKLIEGLEPNTQVYF